jgi:hypothetical protein
LITGALNRKGILLMKNCIFLFILISVHFDVSGQVLRGIVLDKQTKETIDFASVYFSGTFNGTYTDKMGAFELKLSASPMPLTISAIGYYSETIASYTTDKPLKIYLTPKVYELNEVVISDRSLAKERKLNLVIFLNEFLGKTVNANQCTIINENDISFNYGNDRDTLKAYASKPLIIENRALGYKITYFLDQFEYYKNSSSFMFKGSMIFSKDYSKEDSLHSDQYERKRKNCYLGSRMHFFRMLWADALNSSGFKVQNSLGEILTYNNIVVEEGNRKYLRYRDNLKITYYVEKASSTIEFLKQRVFFDNSGYHDASGVLWSGNMSEQRVADWIPYEYIFRYF